MMMNKFIKLKSKFKLVIFDMDGVIVDSEEHWAAVGPELWGKLGVKYNKTIEKDILGFNTADSVKIINAKHGYNVPVIEAQSVYKGFRKVVYTERSNLLPGVFELMKALQKSGIKMTIASGASFESIGRVMDKHKLHSFFKHILSTHDMNIPGKPNPAVFKKSIKAAKVNPSEAVVIEDSLPGVEAAIKSGAKVIAVLGSSTKAKTFAHADLFTKTLKSKKVYKFLGI